MQRALKTDATLKSAKGRRVDEGKGYCSLIASIQMEWTPDGKPVDSLLTRVVAKIPMVSKANAAFENMQTSHGGDKDKVVTFEKMTESLKIEDEPFDMMTMMHNQECIAYDILTKDGTAPPPVLIATCYYHEKHSSKPGAPPGVLLMEDLSDRGKVPDFADNLTLGQVRAIYRSLAQLHAWCLTNPGWEVKHPQRKFSKQEMAAFPQMMRSGVETLKRMPISKDIVKMSDAIADKLYDIDAIWEIFDPESTAHGPFVLVHGDLWTQNMFFGYDKKKNAFTDDLVALIDWQAARPGGCFEDMVRFLFSSVDYRLRREHEYKLIDEYHAELVRLLKGSGVIAPYSADEVKKWYSKAKKMGVAIMTMHAPLVLATPEASGNYTEEQKLNLVWRVQAGIEDIEV